MRLASALIDELDDEALDRLAERLAPRIAARLQRSTGGDWLRGARQIADYLGCQPSRVYALSSLGRIPVQRDGSALVARRTDLDAWVEAGGARRP